ncbi:hypothetical protein [Rufibacter quisquiliarum]|uniref:Uncharacterized protein n=1 Tax=Rufibacter quisquiliarum TaxID=1549639 RepID=A0A839GNZ1_9BACT|nr:hypothetical protein [Rufibacter quisquiliarum]MBA9075561.1 hypothetical protein [Rufibacter quisquiliarum]
MKLQWDFAPEQTAQPRETADHALHQQQLAKETAVNHSSICSSGKNETFAPVRHCIQLPSKGNSRLRIPTLPQSPSPKPTEKQPKHSLKHLRQILQQAKKNLTGIV